jgi:hypothetical protein
MGLGWVFAWVVTPIYLTVLILLLYPQKYLTPYVLRFLQAYIIVSEYKVRVVHIMLVLTGIYFYSNFSKNWEHETTFELLSPAEKLSRAKDERDLYLSGVAFSCVLYTWRLAGLVENYQKGKR